MVTKKGGRIRLKTEKLPFCAKFNLETGFFKNKVSAQANTKQTF